MDFPPIYSIGTTCWMRNASFKRFSDIFCLTSSLYEVMSGVAFFLQHDEGIFMSLTFQSLDHIRQRLLDLSKRNQLLNYREKRRTLHVSVTLSLDKIFHKLVQEGKHLPLISEKIEQRSPEEFLPSRSFGSPKKIQEVLYTPYKEEILVKKCKKLAQEARLAIDETGSNVLFLAMGFLVWFEQRQLYKAPLILIPVKLERQTHQNYVLTSYEEEIETNLSLVEKLAQDFNLNVPRFVQDSRPEAYLSQVAQVIHAFPEWQVIPEIKLDFFSFNKLLMYNDLDEKNWPDHAKLSDHLHFKQLLEGLNPSKIEAGAEEEHSLFEQTPLVLDADSSQWAVMRDVLWKKHNLVVIGPPGTGKSQTIANLIAALLAQGKTVLFVAEKRAALEVVQSRLERVGLGTFCLELHGHNIQKSAFYEQMRIRLEKQWSPCSTHQEVQEWTVQKQKLLAYTQLMNQEVGPHREKIYEIFWKVERLRGEISGRIPVVEITFPWTRQEFDQRLEKLKEVLSYYQMLSIEVVQAWQGFKPIPLLPGDEEVIAQILTSLFLETQSYQAYLDVLMEEVQLPIEQNLEDLQCIDAIKQEHLVSPPSVWSPTLAGKLLEERNIEHFKLFQNAKNEYMQLASQAIKILGRDIQSMQMIQQIAKASKKLEELGFGNDSPEELLYFVNSVEKLSAELQQLLNKHAESVNNFLSFLQLRELAHQAPRDLVIHKHPSHALEVTRFVFEHARRTFESLAQQWYAYKKDFILSKLPDPTCLSRLADELHKYRGKWLAFLSPEYRQTQREIKSFLSSTQLFHDAELAEKLESVALIKQKLLQEVGREQYTQLLGPLFEDLSTDWEHLAEHIQWARKLSEVLGSQDKAYELLSTQDDPQSYIFQSTALLYEQWLRVDKIAKQLNIKIDSHVLIETFVEKLLERRQVVEELVTVLQQLPTVMDKPMISIQAAAQNLLNAWRIRTHIERNPSFNKLFGKAYQGIQTETAAFAGVVEWITQLKESQMPMSLLAWLVSEEPEHRLAILRSLLNNTKNYLTKFFEACQQLGKFGALDRSQWMKCTDRQCTLGHIIQVVTACQSWVSILPTYATFYRVKQEADALGLAPFTEVLVSEYVLPEQVLLNFQYGVYQALARDLIRQYPELANFSRITYEEVRHRFVQADKKLLQKTPSQLAYQIVQRPVPQGNKSGKVASYSEKSLIEHELSKKTKHLPVRQLVKRASQALLALKPCFMMSPLSVVQYLPPGEIEFDVLIFDEASQVRPEDALSAIARSKKIVVVGDPKQLPPTTFFEKISEEEESQILVQESILDRCLSLYPKRSLRWHYRSEHERLIAFSNHYFYENALMVFPSMSGAHQAIGYHYIEGATYWRGRNEREAEAVVRAVLEHVRQFPHVSLGVATFNRDQQELISELLEKEGMGQEEGVKGKEEAKSEPFFVKNLENVQGDERDVIFVSTTYGPDLHTGRVYQRFGPLSSEWGWRRLNVMFTRAKQRLELFTSLRSSDIKEETGAWALKAYLEYAERGGVLPQREEDIQPEGDFEVVIKRVLQEHGYQSVAQIGVAGVRVDVGVCHPVRSQEYMLGILYDGPHYHQEDSVRDRERLRQEILEAKGWVLHRIWSPDWFKNREAEVMRLLQAINLCLVRETSRTDVVLH